MLLAIDVGNTQTALGLFDGDTLSEHRRLATDGNRTGDELGALLGDLVDLGSVDGICLSSTVPALIREYELFAERWAKAPLLVVEPGVRTGIPMRHDAPHQVGPDRIVNSVAAKERYGAPCIVVDFGTSTNFDVVSPQGEYVGGVLAPGIEISMEALFARAARLTKVDFAEPASVIGKTTSSALQSGLVYGFAGQVDGICLSSSVPALLREYEQFAERWAGVPLLVLGPGVRTGMPIRYDDPREVGPDRIANAVGARDRYGPPCIVVDFGTSTNFDVVSAEGEYVGGVLAPGIEISMDALFARAARLFRVDFTEPPSVIGKTTAAGLQSGLVYGFTGQVDEIVRRIRGELAAEAPAIATGGLAELVAPHSATIERVDPWLTLTGLRLVWELNRDS